MGGGGGEEDSRHHSCEWSDKKKKDSEVVSTLDLMHSQPKFIRGETSRQTTSKSLIHCAHATSRGGRNFKNEIGKTKKEEIVQKQRTSGSGRSTPVLLLSAS